MARVTVDNGNVEVRVEGLHKVWAVKRGLTVPLAHVRQVSGNPDGIRRPPAVWAVGCWLPGVIVAGTFHSRGKREFWDVRHPANAVIIDLQDDPYTRLVLEVDDPSSTIAQINRSRP